ncbi:MAG TPA: gluconate 2-dehydrogenase subunit 3 family protein [Ktedonobacteraceae bacterium]
MKLLKRKTLKTPPELAHPASPERTSIGDTSLLPIDPHTGQPIAPSEQPGYYPGYHTLSQQDFWDEATRKVVLDRIEKVPPILFFTPDEALFMEAVCRRLLPQDDRDDTHKIPLLNYIDDRLYHKRLQGYRYEDMPPDDEAYRLGIQAIEAIAQHMYHTPFTTLGPQEQDAVLLTIQQGQPPSGHEIWQKMSVHRFWSLLMEDVVDVYYAHPYAWDEIGFGGPAYPRGYMRLERGEPEPWEVEEQRYDWETPTTALSGEYRLPGGTGGHKQQPPGQTGTH